MPFSKVPENLSSEKTINNENQKQHKNNGITTKTSTSICIVNDTLTVKKSPQKCADQQITVGEFHLASSSHLSVLKLRRKE
jgi:hypothetical protein